MRVAHFKVTEVSPGVWSIRPAALDELPGPCDDGGLVIRVVNLPEIAAREIMNKLARVPDLAALPAIVDWKTWPA